MGRKKPVKHTVHTKHPRYQTSEYDRGKGGRGACGGTRQFDGQGRRDFSTPLLKPTPNLKINPPSRRYVIKIIRSKDSKANPEFGLDKGDLYKKGDIIGIWSTPHTFKQAQKSKEQLEKISGEEVVIQKMKTPMWTSDLIPIQAPKTHKNTSYFPTRESAKLYAEANMLPTDRIIGYGRGYAIQKEASGRYFNVKTYSWM